MNIHARIPTHVHPIEIPHRHGHSLPPTQTLKSILMNNGYRYLSHWANTNPGTGALEGKEHTSKE